MASDLAAQGEDTHLLTTPPLIELLEAQADSSAPSTIETTDQFLLRIGERLFHTSLDTLASKCDYFKAYRSGRWFPDHSGALFIDADPEAFEHILRFCRTGVFPLCWSKEGGHDYTLYARIKESAEYFMCDKVSKWLEKRWYHECVREKTRYIHISDYQIKKGGFPELNAPSDMDEQVIYLHLMDCTRLKKKVYVCPRGIEVHYGDPMKCGKACRSSTNKPDPDFRYCLEGVIEMRKTAVFNRGWMTENGSEFLEAYTGSN